jgi:Prolipoprotein diacylglyceryl transferase
MSGLDRLVGMQMTIAGRRWASFRVCGGVGWIAGTLLALFLVAHQDLPLWVIGVLAVGSVVTFLGLVMAVKVVTGEENIVYYHHEIALVVVSTLILWRLGMPLLPYLDAVVMGLGLFLACGRIGCLLVGCCHGRPCSWGVAYGPTHVAAGLSPNFVGVRVFPIQFAEAAFVTVTVGVGTFLVLGGAPPGSALAFYSIAYGVARFCFEFFRGDTVRPYWRGGSEAQWTSLVIAAVMLGLSTFGPLPLGSWLLAATMGMGVALLVGALLDGPRRALFRPRHIDEIAHLLDATRRQASTTGELHGGRTSLGLRISASTIHSGGRWLDVFALSEETVSLDDRTARRLARLICRLRRSATDGEVQRGGHGVYHLILPAAGSVREMAHAV